MASLAVTTLNAGEKASASIFASVGAIQSLRAEKGYPTGHPPLAE